MATTNWLTEPIFGLVNWLNYGFFIVSGLIIGSFINVVVTRLPIMLERQWYKQATIYLDNSSVAVDRQTNKYNLLFPASHCPSCREPIAWYDNIPLCSWIILRGRCRHCQTPISPRYPAVECVFAISSLLLGQLFPVSFVLIGWLLFSGLLITLASIDYEKLILPDQLTLFMLWSGLVFNLNGSFVPLSAAVIGAIAGYLVLWSVYWLFKLFTNKEGIGYGDFKLLAAIGAWLGWRALLNIVLLSSLLAIIITTLLAWRKRRTIIEPIPFGSYLACSGWLVLFSKLLLGWPITSQIG